MKLLYASLVILLFSSMAFSQLGNRYFHTDTLNISTSARDTTWTTSWEVATIYADTVNVMLTIGAPDVGEWASRLPMYLETGMSLTIGPTPKLKRLKVSTTTGVGVLYIVGYKKARQY